MDRNTALNRNISVAGWSLLFIWWGVSILIDPITIGMCAVGTGIIQLGANAIRRSAGLPVVRSSTAFGLVLLLWGSLDTALALSLGASIAVFFIVVGVVCFGALLAGAAAPAAA